MHIEMDMDATQESSGFEPLPDGEYFLVCTDVEDGKNQPGKFPYIKLELTVSEGEYQNRKVWYNLVLLPKDHKSHGMTVHAFKAFGLPYDGQVSFDSSEFKGRGCKANVNTETREYNGRNYTSNKVRWFITEEQEIGAQTELAAVSKSW